MRLNQLTSPQADNLDRALPVVVPLGSCEQHGRHLPLFVDTLQVEAVADRVEARLGDRAIFLPPLWLGSSHHHLDYPGTISIRPSVYAMVVAEIARSVLQAGFTKIFFLNGHGGNELPGQTGLTELIATDDEADAATLAFASWWKVAADALEPGAHGLEQPAITHACEVETSLMLAIRPDLVDISAIEPSDPKFASPDWHCERGGRVSVFHRFHRLTTHGHMGTPELATREKGESMLEAITQAVAKFIEDFSTWPTLPQSPARGEAPQ